MSLRAVRLSRTTKQSLVSANTNRYGEIATPASGGLATTFEIMPGIRLRCAADPFTKRPREWWWKALVEFVIIWLADIHS